MEYSGAEIIIRFLEKRGVDWIAGIPGGANLPLYDALANSRLRHVLARHEQGAGFMAQGSARISGKAGVCLATSGPGASNLLTALADARLDSVPLVAITGQVPLGLLGTEAFQEINTCEIFRPVTKAVFAVKDAKDLPGILAEAFQIAESGRPGPVLIDVPKDVQTMKTAWNGWPEGSFKMNSLCPSPDKKEIERAAMMINNSRRPLILAGGGIARSTGFHLARALSKQIGIPSVCTLMGLGVFEPDDPYYCGMIGMHGDVLANRLLEQTDMLLTLGCRFGDRATGKVSEFCSRAGIIHVDTDSARINSTVTSALGIVAEGEDFLRVIIPLLRNSFSEWRAGVFELKAGFPAFGSSVPAGPRGLILAAASAAGPEAIVVTDVGQHQMWTAQAYPFSRPGCFLTSGGLGTMGFGLPAAIGAALEAPDRKTICFSGDGSLLMNIQELATLAELKAELKIFVFNNRSLGLVRQQQELFYKKNYFASRFERDLDFSRLAREFGVRSITVPEGKDPGPSIAAAFGRPGPCLVEVPIHDSLNVLPMVLPGGGNSRMITGNSEKNAPAPATVPLFSDRLP